MKPRSSKFPLRSNVIWCSDMYFITCVKRRLRYWEAVRNKEGQVIDNEKKAFLRRTGHGDVCSRRRKSHDTTPKTAERQAESACRSFARKPSQAQIHPQLYWVHSHDRPPRSGPARLSVHDQVGFTPSLVRASCGPSGWFQLVSEPGWRQAAMARKQASPICRFLMAKVRPVAQGTSPNTPSARRSRCTPHGWSATAHRTPSRSRCRRYSEDRAGFSRPSRRCPRHSRRRPGRGR